MTILIDPGHGRNTAGKRSPDGRFLEYRFNRQVSNLIVADLLDKGHDARLIVPEETDIPLLERCNRANAIAYILFVAFYVYVAILFIGQGYNRSLVAQLYDSLDIKKSKPEAAGSLDRLGVALKKWVDKKNYIISDVSTESIAESLDTDIFTFREYFRQVIGEDFRTWRQRLRIEEACRIMTENPSMSYELVAEAVGINDRSNFKKSFVKFKGMSPNEWKENFFPTKAQKSLPPMPSRRDQ